jgi:S-adenosylmethionine hydrolase
LKDPYVAEMKAAILSICPSAVLVDLTHGVEKFNVRAAAFLLASAVPYFPKGTIHVAVVDPCVGTERRPIIVETESGFFVGPDNGLLILAAEATGTKQMRHIENRQLMLPNVSSTFHGRDIFAPAAAHLANNVLMEEFGPKITDIVKPEFTRITRSKDYLTGAVLYVDDFGNMITNISAKDIAFFREDIVQIELAFQTLKHLRVYRTYADAKPHEPVALIGSHGYLEIALNQGNAAAKFFAKAGDKIKLSRA